MKTAIRIVTALACAAAAFFALSWAFIGWDASLEDVFPAGTVLRNSAGEPIRVTLGPGDTDCRPTYRANRDDWIVKAIVAAEDGEFWEHRGVRPASVLRAAAQNAFSARRISGASTLTMQAARLIHPHAKTYWGKWVEAIRALKLERLHSKEWILSQYLNRVPFGANYAGIEAAANGWFGKDAASLGLGEAAILAAIVQAPSRLRPDRGGEKTLKRRDYVLARMRTLGMIDEEQERAARAVVPELQRGRRPFRHPFFCDWYLGETAARRAKPWDERTGLDEDLQRICDEAVKDAETHVGYSAAAVIVRNGAARPGDVVALACSGNYFARDAGQVNTATARRPAGSTLKPILAALALRLGIATPDMRLMDAPIVRRGYRPANFDGAYRGPVSLRDALVLSLNIPFVLLLEKTGLERFADELRALGFGGLERPDGDFGLGLAIGNAEITLVELARAYAGAVAGADGGAGDDEARASAMWLVGEILSGAERSSAALGHIADVSALPRFAWKTGTSAAHRDAWCVLWNPEYTIAVWCGHKRGGFDDAALVGALAAAPRAWRIARAIYPRGGGPWFEKPAAIATRRICRESGLCALTECPETEEGFYIRGVSTPEACDIHARPLAGRARPLAIARPEDGAVFRIADGMERQKIALVPLGNEARNSLWWFIDGEFAGTSAGTAPFTIDPRPGEHSATCADAAGRSATVRFSVR